MDTKAATRRRRRNAQPPTKVPPQPVEVTAADPRAWSTALKLAGGDHRRLLVHKDGAVTVLNHPRRR